jgi:flagellar hook assembly protein FlgD
MSLRVFDARGRLVRTLVEGYREAGPGSARWDGRDRRGTAVASGVYFYRLTVGGERLTRRMHLVK